ncbi:50S ribosomal protein L22 [Rubrivirga marina]|uniref:Large ribosomal subunit protein uL22 n=1 Tax=Rubrivirga marina TaxID=1196024 RepID=A0A271J031_9BACT|nr:50S ribosomal protein L22 [Rubrivirga marina]PAP76852.1 50S ribosomal protein L22 [Rubrivirga marina]
MEARAKRKYLRISPRKMRIVADVVRGKNAQQAIDTLEFMPQKAAAMVRRAIQDAYGNLIDQNQDERIDDERLIVKTIMVDQAPVIKRFRPVSRGRAHPILKRSSHLTVVVGTPDEKEPRSIRQGERVED